MIRIVALSLLIAAGAPLSAQQLPATLDELAATPVVTVQISQQLRSPPDEASLNASTEAREPTAVAALASSKTKTEKLIAAIRAAGIAAKDIQTDGVSINADYDYQTIDNRSVRRFNGYVARNSVRIKTRQIDRLVSLLDTLTGAGATDVYGPSFSIANQAPLRTEARKRAMARGEMEAGEYARNAGFARVRLLSVQEGVSYEATDVVVNDLPRIVAAPPPPPPPPPGGGGSIQPGQIETGVTLTLRYRMEH